MNTKQRICQVAMKLFGEQGFEQVSLRDIAKKADTTIGNMTYHFPKKEDLVTAIQQELHLDYLKELEVDRYEEPLNKLYHSFKLAEKNQHLNPFYYENMVELTSNFESIAIKNQEFRSRLHDFYLEIFVRLAEQGLFLVQPHEIFKSLAFSIVLLETMWLQHGSPYYDEPYDTPSILTTLTYLIVPYLSEEGIKSWSSFKK